MGNSSFYSLYLQFTLSQKKLGSSISIQTGARLNVSPAWNIWGHLVRNICRRIDGDTTAWHQDSRPGATCSNGQSGVQGLAGGLGFGNNIIQHIWFLFKEISRNTRAVIKWKWGTAESKSTQFSYECFKTIIKVWSFSLIWGKLENMNQVGVTPRFIIESYEVCPWDIH